MIGVYNDELDKLIKLNILNEETLLNNIKQLLMTINELPICCVGKDLQFVYNELLSQRKEINKICKLVNNYTTILSEVRLSYKMQDENIKNILNRQNRQV